MFGLLLEDSREPPARPPSRLTVPTAPAIAREKKTVAAMVRIYCADHRHDAAAGDCMCDTCRKPRRAPASR